ncbi:MAG TPA: glycosyltransferase family 39 protein [Acidimicrobiales bacterium]|nr:glycosyltransferase family 39 protein [Acidimicrobiales bacterium]
MSTVAERLRSGAPEATRDQMVVAGGQLAAGAGNMAFALLLARVLSPGAFAQVASFLAIYLLLSMPASAVTAAAALDPARIARLRPALLLGGAAVGVVLAAASPWVGPALRLPVPMVVVLGLSCPAVGTLAAERGRLYGWHRHRRLVASLVAEPSVRLLLGLTLAAVGGAVGAAFGVAVAGYAALEVARRRAATPSPGPSVEPRRPPASRAAVWTAVAFLAVVVVQNQDLLLANRVLPPAQAGQFAVLSTLGGLSVFATMTVPMVLLPRSASGDDRGLWPALSLTALIGGGAVGVVALAPEALVVGLFGDRYRQVGAVLVPYMAAMALLGLARVLVAHRCATGAGRSSLLFVLPAVALQGSLIVVFGHDVRAVAYATVAAVTGLTVSLGVAEVGRRSTAAGRLPALRQWLPALRGRLAALRGRLAAVTTRPVVLLVGAACAVGLAVRFVVPRGLWLDEATSVTQARMSFAGMIHNLRTTDVHPPLYFSVLWATVHWFGSGELAVRVPSIVAGTLVVPMLYLLGREAYDRRTGVVAALVGSVAPILVWYSQEARMYALLTLFGVVAIWAQVRILRRGGRLVWVVYAAASVAMVWTQYFGVLQVVVQQVVFLWAVVTRHRRGEPVRGLVTGWAVTAAAIVVWLAPLLPFAYQQYMVNQTAGKGFGGPQQVGSATSLSGTRLSIYAALANVIWAVWGYQPTSSMVLLAALWPLGVLFALVLLGRRQRWPTTLLVAGVLVPGAAMFALGLVKRNLFDIRYMSTVVPLLLVLLARLVAAVPRRVTGVVVATCVLLGTLVVGLVDQQFNGTNPRLYDFRGALAAVEARARPGDLVIYDPSDLREVVGYYGPDLRLSPVRSTVATPTARRMVFVVASPALMHGASDAGGLRRTLRALRADGRQVEHRTLSNVEVWAFQ